LVTKSIHLNSQLLKNKKKLEKKRKKKKRPFWWRGLLRPSEFLGRERQR
jgi:hypothetical protein